MSVDRLFIAVAIEMKVRPARVYKLLVNDVETVNKQTNSANAKTEEGN